MIENITIRAIKSNEWEEAMRLAWETFLRFETRDYSSEGVNSFREFVKSSALKELFQKGEYPVWAAFDKGIMVGVTSVRNKSHISLLFVDGDYHHRGIASELIRVVFNHVRDVEGLAEVTVNAAPYAIGFYHKMGFIDLDAEKAVDGIRYTPMVAVLNNIK